MLYFSRRVPQAAACLAYFVLLTVFPVLICVSYILGMVNIDIVSLMDQLQPLLPEAALDVLESYLRYISFHQTPGLFLAGLAGCWFSAAAAFRTITRVIIDSMRMCPNPWSGAWWPAFSSPWGCWSRWTCP